ncbi:MAG TPA: heavy metal-binding domain-containing protein [Pyrinomonadaceae bacterium]|nr:heavy metal-binding domain-containing protein [Pyrinomonadaceae bacterium]
MTKRMYAAFTSCIAVILMLAFAESPSAFAIHDHYQRQEHGQVVSRRNRAAVKRVKARRQVRQREISYVCPMHSDIRSKSPSTCPKCMMKLVAEKPDAKVSRR